MIMYNNGYTPPVNNLLQPDIYNRLDAEAIEKTRVVNTQLDEKLRAQERILAKYRIAAERFHRREAARVQEELTKISTRLPAACRIKDFRSKFLHGIRRNSMPASLQSSERKIRGVPEEKTDLPFCERYFIHHLPTKKKYYKRRTPTPPLRGAKGTLPSGEVTEALLPPLDSSGAMNLINGNVTGVDGLTDLRTKLKEDNHGLGVGSAVDSGLGSEVNEHQSLDHDHVDLVSGGTPREQRLRNGRGDKTYRKSPRREKEEHFLPPVDETYKTQSNRSPQLLQG